MKKNIEKQEAVVHALWEFAHALQTKSHDTTNTSLDGKKVTTVHLNSVGEALEEIMKTFGYEVVPLQ